MMELCQYHTNTTNTIEPEARTTSGYLDGWRSMYTMKDISSCIDKIQPVRYTESQDVFATLRCIAYSSGYCLGGTHWLIETSFFKKIAFLSTCSIQPNLHPLPFDPSLLSEADVVIVSGLGSTQVPFERSRTKVLAQIARTIQARHNVVLPSSSIGLVFDLIGDICHHFKMIGMEVGHEQHQTPIYVVSPIAERSLKYANICGEWMTSDRQDLLYLPQSPLVHGSLMKSGALTTYSHIDHNTAIREPCIVFSSDPVHLNKGPVSWFLKTWTSLNTCIVTNPDGPVHPPADCRMNFIYQPLDTRTRLEDMVSIFQMYWTKQEDRYLVIPSNQSCIDLFKDQVTELHVYEQGDIIGIELNRDWERVTISEKLAKTIVPLPLPHKKDGSVSLYAPIKGLLYLYNNHYELHPMTTNRYDDDLQEEHQDATQQ
ncbi:beta-lactamase-like protein [Pilobolus umbonatus]|nr:beta-lactamase-like protein [Pilobolus umbonatus]